MHELEMIDRVAKRLKLDKRTVRRFFDVLGLVDRSIDEAVIAIRAARKDGFQLKERKRR